MPRERKKASFFERGGFRHGFSECGLHMNILPLELEEDRVSTLSIYVITGSSLIIKPHKSITWSDLENLKGFNECLDTCEKAIMKVGNIFIRPRYEN